MKSGLKAMEMDRISDLPQPILHHILSSVSQNDAVKTCVLSKSWRYLWYGRPNVEFRIDDFKGTAQNFISVLEQTLIRYGNQNLSIQKFILEMPEMIGPFSDPFLEKWIPIVKVLFRHLQTLRLCYVKVEEETFERIMSSCPLIEEVSLRYCEGLNTIKVNNHNCSLKYFEFRSYNSGSYTIKVNNSFTHLKSLHPSFVKLTTKSVDIFSCNFPCLEELQLSDCYGAFEEFQLSSRSIKRLSIEADLVDDPIKVSIDAPNLFLFEYKGCDLPPHISFTTTSNKWKSKIDLTADLDLDDISKWLHKLDELLNLLSLSETSLHILVKCDEDYIRCVGRPDKQIKVIVKHVEELCLGSLCSDYSVWLEREDISTIEKWNS